MKIRTFWQAAAAADVDGEEFKLPSLTVDDGYEDLDVMVARIIRGDLPSKRQTFYELDSDPKDEDFDRPCYDDLDDLTDIDSARDILNSGVAASAQPAAHSKAATDAVVDGKEAKKDSDSSVAE